MEIKETMVTMTKCKNPNCNCESCDCESCDCDEKE